MTTHRALYAILCCSLTLSSVCARPVSVVAANTVLADLVQEIGGDAVEVTCLARPGSDLHDFEPRASDVRVLAGAEIVVLNGLGLEPWIGKLVRNSGFRGTVVEAAEGVAVIAGHEHDGDGHAKDHAVDPHAWHEPASTRVYVRNIRNALAVAAPDSAAKFAGLETDFLKRLEEIDAWARAGFAALPADRRRFVTSHDSLAYLGRAYAIEIISVSGISASAEPSAKRVAEVIDLIRTTGVRAAFFDPGDNPAIMRTIASEAGVRIGGGLYTDGLGAPGSEADTYLGMLEHNLRRILDSLQ